MRRRIRSCLGVKFMAVWWGAGGVRGESIESVADRGLDMPDLLALVGEECGERGIAPAVPVHLLVAEEGEDLLKESRPERASAGRRPPGAAGFRTGGSGRGRPGGTGNRGQRDEAVTVRDQRHLEIASRSEPDQGHGGRTPGRIRSEGAGLRLTNHLGFLSVASTRFHRRPGRPV